jgi:hypothetical protein
MPKGPKGEKRPADVIGAAIMVARIATGEAEETAREDPAGTAPGSKGGVARAQTMTPERRTQVAKNAAKARWKKPAPVD